MKKKDLANLGLTEEQTQGVLDTYKKVIIGFVPKTRLDQVIQERNALKTTVDEKNEQLSVLKQTILDHEELAKQIKQLQTDNKAINDKLEQAKKSLKVAIEMIL
jgi:septal ring factor EnvC (AmiA/AmiB activator)